MPIENWESVSVKGGWHFKCTFYTVYLVEEKMWKTLGTGQQTWLIKGVGGRCLRLCGLDSSWLKSLTISWRLDSTSLPLEDGHCPVDRTPHGWLYKMTTLLWTGLPSSALWTMNTTLGPGTWTGLHILVLLLASSGTWDHAMKLVNTAVIDTGG